MALFGWQGLSFSHPDDWAPVVISGDRRAGYARLAGSGRTGCQIRWQKSKRPLSLVPTLQSYFARLSKDAKRAKMRFDADWKEEDGKLLYRWTAVDQGRGLLFFRQACSRTVFLEAFGGRKDSLLPFLKGLIESSESQAPEGRELWALYGLELLLPVKLKVVRKRLESGRTSLDFAARGVTIECQRWAFGEQLIAKHGLEDWARAVLKEPKAEASLAQQGLKLARRSSAAGCSVCIVQYQPERNQIVTVRTRYRNPKWEPRWDWLA